MLLENLALFLRIVEVGGMAAAGRELGLSPATVSERLAALEVHYGARLLVRTTRSISLTDEGRELVAGARRILAETEETEARIRLGVDKISGEIRLSAPIDLGRNQIIPLLDAFLAEHPGVSVDLTLHDGFVDLVGQGLDLAIRYGDLAASSLKARRLADNRRVVCASPDYLASHGTPDHPDELGEHNCIVMRFGPHADRDWSFVIDGKSAIRIVRGDRIANDGELVRRWCLAGHGLAMKAWWDVGDDLARGNLVPLLEAFEPEPTTLQMVYPSGAVQPRRVRALMERLASHFGPGHPNQA